jgi:tetratricopeptide (TPR) repeat protein
MKEDELKKFRDDLQKDPELVQELDLHRSLNDIILSTDEVRFRKKLNEAYKAYNIAPLNKGNKEITVHGSRIFKFAVVTVPIFLIFIIGFYFLEFRKESNQSIFESNLITFHKDFQLRAQTSGAKEINILQQGLNLFNQKKYFDASRFFLHNLSLNPGNIDAHFYNGLCYMYLNEFNNAITSFDFVVNQPFNYYYEYAKWYMAMSYIRIDNNETARLLLNEIVADNGFLSDRAKKVFRKLR